MYQSIVGTQAGTQVPGTFGDYFRGLANGGATSGQIEYMMKKYAASDNSNNLIAQCAIIEDPVEAGIQPMNPPQYTGVGGVDQYARDVENQRTEQLNTFRSEYEVFNRANPSVQISDDVRGIRFKAGTRIQEIIEEVIVNSTYGRAIATQLNNNTDPQGMITWFSVETDTYILPDEEELARTGNYPQLFVYRIVPYKTTMDFFITKKSPPGLSALKSECAKQYNYIYTGKNKDILDLEIQFNSSFIYPVNADRGGGSANTAQGATNQMTMGATDAPLTTSGGGNAAGAPGAGTDAGGANRESVGPSGGSQAAGLDNSAIQVARQFNDRLLQSRADMLNVEMTIMGDPFYLSDGGYGNYHAKDTSYTNITACDSVTWNGITYNQSGNYSYNGNNNLNNNFSLNFDVDRKIQPTRLAVGMEAGFTGFFSEEAVAHAVTPAGTDHYQARIDVSHSRAQSP